LVKFTAGDRIYWKCTLRVGEPKSESLVVLIQRLAIEWICQATDVKNREHVGRMRLAAWVFSPSDSHKIVGSAVSSARRLLQIQKAPGASAPGGVGCPARRCLQVLVVLRRYTPGGTCSRHTILLQQYWCAWSTRLLVMLQSWVCWCSLSWAQNVSLEFSLGWRMNTRNPWVELRLASVASVSVLVVSSTDGSK